MFMGGRNDSKSMIVEVDMNLNGKPGPDGLCPIEIPRLNAGYKMGTSI